MNKVTALVANPWAEHDPDDYKARYRRLKAKHDIESGQRHGKYGYTRAGYFQPKG